jgi:hypothetical protein
MAVVTTKPRTTPTAWQRFRSGNLSDTQLGFLLLTPALLTLALVMFYPIANVLWRSLHFERLNQPQRGTPFIGLEHFREMLWGREMTWDITNHWLALFFCSGFTLAKKADGMTADFGIRFKLPGSLLSSASQERF